MRLFNKKKKKSRFVSEGQPPEINSSGIEHEYKYNLYTKIILLICVLLGIILCVCDIRDDGMLLKLSIGGDTEFKYVGSLAGLAIVVISILVMLLHTPQVHLKK